MPRRGFTLIEVLLVVGVLGVVSMFSVPAYRTYQARSDLNLATEQTIQGLARAKLLSQNAEGDSGWGFYVPAGVLYRGAGYGAREAGADEVFPMPSTVSVSGSILDVSYSKLEGKPSATGSIILTAVDGQQRIIVITIVVGREQLAAVPGQLSSSSLASSSAASSVQSSGASSAGSVSSQASAQSSSVSSGAGGAGSSAGGAFTICHKPGTHAEQTMAVQPTAWSAHQRHGDTVGACTNSRPGSLCPSRYQISANGTIETVTSLATTVRVIATELTFGAGGPDIPVKLWYTKNGGSKWTSLFSGNAVSPGQFQTVQIPNGSSFAVRIRGTFRLLGWLLFDEKTETNDGSDHTIILRNGDPLPAYLPFPRQQSLQSILAGYLDASQHISIPASSLIVLTELSVIDFPVTISEDFQDTVLLLEFAGSPAC
ncbi:MAG: prepilin-type N-terminal cleavage/methylation domain-containing protein [Candidatus Peribacteraceae bacterium]